MTTYIIIINRKLKKDDRVFSGCLDMSGLVSSKSRSDVSFFSALGHYLRLIVSLWKRVKVPSCRCERKWRWLLLFCLILLLILSKVDCKTFSHSSGGGVLYGCSSHWGKRAASTHLTIFMGENTKDSRFPSIVMSFLSRVYILRYVNSLENVFIRRTEKKKI